MEMLIVITARFVTKSMMLNLKKSHFMKSIRSTFLLLATNMIHIGFYSSEKVTILNRTMTKIRNMILITLENIGGMVQTMN